MQVTRPSPDEVVSPPPASNPLGPVIENIEAAAAGLDRVPAFPTAALAALGAMRALAADQDYTTQLDLVRAVARADGSVGRILDGHLNAAERLRVHHDPAGDLELVDAGGLWLGLWGADPVGDEGEPAGIEGGPGGWRLSGTKVFCSGAGGVHRALVIARPPDRSSAKWLVYVDLSAGVEIDRSWFRGAGMRASESHLVRFDRAQVLAVLGEPGELGREPWFSRDAVRTAASWAGMADAAVECALSSLAARPTLGDLEGLAAGRILSAQKTIDLWLGAAAEDPAGLTGLSVHLRHAVSVAAVTILDEAARACGSRPFALGSRLDRARRDLGLLLLQHRLDPLLARSGLKAVRPIDDPRPSRAGMVRRALPG
jgi:alkylation response protein AidB-like acyl-CoA dehydrogenase